MLRALAARLRQGRRTIRYPEGGPALPDRFRGRPSVDFTKCPPECRACAAACPTQAISVENGKGAVDMGRCLFCIECENACPHGAVQFTSEHRLAAWTREDLVVRSPQPEPKGAPDDRRRRIFRFSLAFRQVSAGGCAACEADINVLNTVVFDLGRFGITIAASPRHADGLLITGPVTENMKSALEKTYKALTPPRIVVAIGACAISGGPFAGHPEVHNGAESAVPLDLYIPGCPPHPLTILDGLLRITGRVK